MVIYIPLHVSVLEALLLVVDDGIFQRGQCLKCLKYTLCKGTNTNDKLVVQTGQSKVFFRVFWRSGQTKLP